MEPLPDMVFGLLFFRTFEEPPVELAAELSLVAVWSPVEFWSLLTTAPSELLMMMQLELAVADAPLPFEPAPDAPLVPPQMIVPAPPEPLPGSSTFLIATAIAALGRLKGSHSK